MQEVYLWSSVEFLLRQHPETKKLIDQTMYAWRHWASGLDCEGSQAELMKRRIRNCGDTADRHRSVGKRRPLPAPARCVCRGIRQAALNQSWNAKRRTLTEHLGGSGGLDASLLSLPVRNVIDFDDPRMVSTTKAIAAELDAGNGLLFRYLPEVSLDGPPGNEGAFLLCSPIHRLVKTTRSHRSPGRAVYPRPYPSAAPRSYTRCTGGSLQSQRRERGKVAVTVVRNPFSHAKHGHDDKSKTGPPHRSWLQRENDAISHGKSSLFFIAHDSPPPPSPTCLQGHEILPGETTCSKGHPIG